MKWKVKIEIEPDVFTYAYTKIKGTTLVDNIAVYDDGFPDDGSGWGDDESNTILAQQEIWKNDDPESRCYSCEYIK